MGSDRRVHRRRPGRLGRHRAAFDPVTIARETAEAAADLGRYAHWSNWEHTATLVRAGKAGNPMLDDTARLDLALADQLSPAARSLPGVTSYAQSLHWQMGTLTGATVVPVLNDGADELSLLDGLKAQTTPTPR